MLHTADQHLDEGAAELRTLVAEEVRSWMARRKVTGEALAAALGKSGTTVSRRLKGRTAFDIDDLHKISIALEVPLQVLLEPALTRRDREVFEPEGTPIFEGLARSWFERARRPAAAATSPSALNAEKSSFYSSAGQHVAPPMGGRPVAQGAGDCDVRRKAA